MTKDVATNICDQLEKDGFGYTRVADAAGNHTITLSTSSITGMEMVTLFNILAPGGVPLQGVVATLGGNIAVE